MNYLRKVAVILASLSMVACGGNSVRYDNSAGKATIYEDVGTTSNQVSGIGVESQDIVSMTDQMMRDMLQNPTLMGGVQAPRVIIDSQYMMTESTS
ncbi:MAG: penicillin-binding protein activator LpoB, partial [Gammaproteobacteria bacterium]